MLRIWSWNVNGQHLWDRLDASEVDIALLQEAPAPPVAWKAKVTPSPAPGVHWSTAGRPRRLWRTAIVAVSTAAAIVPRPPTSIDEEDPEALTVSRRGTLTLANVVVGGETITLVSMYAAWEAPVKGHLPLEKYADASAHRLLSDLSGIMTHQNRHRIIAAGDLNILNRYGEHGSPYWAARYATIFDRAKAMGLQFVGPQAPYGRQASPRPDELPAGSLDVPTYHTRAQGPIGATRQIDFVFASQALADRLVVRALNTDVKEWGPSDHCRIAIELQT